MCLAQVAAVEEEEEVATAEEEEEEEAEATMEAAAVVTEAAAVDTTADNLHVSMKEQNSIAGEKKSSNEITRLLSGKTICKEGRRGAFQILGF